MISGVHVHSVIPMGRCCSRNFSGSFPKNCSELSAWQPLKTTVNNPVPCWMSPSKASFFPRSSRYAWRDLRNSAHSRSTSLITPKICTVLKPERQVAHQRERHGRTVSFHRPPRRHPFGLRIRQPIEHMFIAVRLARRFCPKFDTERELRVRVDYPGMCWGSGVMTMRQAAADELATLLKKTAGELAGSDTGPSGFPFGRGVAGGLVKPARPKIRSRRGRASAVCCPTAASGASTAA